jgi:cell division protein FtsW
MIDRIAEKNKQLRADMHILLGIIIIIIIVGSLFIYASSSVYALESFGSASYFVEKQLVGIALGFVGLVIAALIPFPIIKKATPLFFVSSLALTALSLIPQFASRIHGSSRWIRLLGFSFQPSELLKVGLLLYLAHFLEKKLSRQESIFTTFIPLMIMLGIPSAILLKQPDFGFTVTLVSTALIVCFIMQFQVKQIFFSMIGLIPLVIALIAHQPYRVKRITTFLNPWSDPQGSGFQIIQSLIAIGSGGFTGIGIGQSKQKFFYLPMQHTDFILSIIAEETGFVGIFFLITLYLMLLYFGLRIASNMRDTFSQAFTYGAVILISLQAVINMAVTTGMAPTKGIGLPFISYGNTGLITNIKSRCNCVHFPSLCRYSRPFRYVPSRCHPKTHPPILYRHSLPILFRA